MSCVLLAKLNLMKISYLYIALNKMLLNAEIVHRKI